VVGFSLVMDLLIFAILEEAGLLVVPRVEKGGLSVFPRADETCQFVLIIDLNFPFKLYKYYFAKYFYLIDTH
jgi:hypothetical protein